MYIKDNTDVRLELEKIENLPFITLLVTLDVTSLYTNIPYSEGVAACRTELNTRQVMQPSIEYLIELIPMIFTKDNFTFEGAHYPKIYEMAVGT